MQDLPIDNGSTVHSPDLLHRFPARARFYLGPLEASQGPEPIAAKNQKEEVGTFTSGTISGAPLCVRIADRSQPFEQLRALVDVMERASTNDPRLTAEINAVAEALTAILESTHDASPDAAKLDYAILHAVTLAARKIGDQNELLQNLDLTVRKELHAALVTVNHGDDYGLARDAERASWKLSQSHSVTD